MTWRREERGGINFFSSTLLAEEVWLEHGVTAAIQNGESFNLSLSVGDDPEAVCRRRRSVAAAFGCSEDALVLAQQVHGRRVTRVEADATGAGANDPRTAVPATDGLLTSVPGLLLVTQHADCVPILLADPVNRVVAAVHAGWRGTAAQIAVSAVETMKENYGTDPRRCKAAIGPAVGGCCYEVGDEVGEAFSEVLREVGMSFAPKLHLGEINRRLLIRAGLAPDAVDLAPWCTICGGGLFFSHRRQGTLAGRMWSLILRKF